MKRVYLLILLFLLSLPMVSHCEEGKQFSLFPVPLTANTLNVEIHNSANIASFELRSLIGKKLQEKKYTGKESKIEFNDMSQYYSGIYVIIAKDANGKIVETMKFTINR